MSYNRSHDGTLIATGGTAGVLTIWEYQTAEKISRIVGHAGSINSICFSPDDKQVITTGEDGCIAIWCVFSQDSGY